MKSFKEFLNSTDKIAEAATHSIHRIQNADMVKGTYMNVPYTGFVATQRVHPTNHDIRIFTVKLDKPIVVHGTHMTFLTINASDNPALASDRIALREASGSDQYQTVLHAETLKKLQHICHEINSGKGRAKGAYADRPGADRKLEVLPVSHHQHLSKAARIHLQNDGIVFLLVTVRPGQRPEQEDIAFVINGYNNQIINAHAYFSHRYTYHDVTGTVEHPNYDAMVSAAGL